MDSEPERSGDHAETDDKPVRNEGQRLLREVEGSLASIGQSVGTTKQAVSYWRNGDKLPEERARRALHALYDIPISAWDRVPGHAIAYEDEDKDDDEPNALQDVQRLIRILRSQLRRPDLMSRERVQLADAFSKALGQKERLERAREMLEDRTIREHPKWQRLKDALIEALLPYPDAARAAEQAVLRVLGEEESAADESGDPVIR